MEYTKPTNRQVVVDILESGWGNYEETNYASDTEGLS